MKLSFAITLLSFLIQLFSASYIRVETCIGNDNGVAYYEICGEVFGEYSDAQQGDEVVLFMNDQNTADIVDDTIVWSYVVED